MPVYIRGEQCSDYKNGNESLLIANVSSSFAKNGIKRKYLGKLQFVSHQCDIWF